MKVSFPVFILGIGAVLLGASAWDLLVYGRHRLPEPPRWGLGTADVGRGREAIVRHGCGACHVIPGIRTATGRVGPRLNGIGGQVYVAGVLPNTPENLVRWIRFPQDINPRTAMPNLGVSEQEARDIAAYLFERAR